jgi:aspartate dehydrogenase
MKKLKIGIAGCGAIGSSLAKIIRKDFFAKAVLAGLFDIDETKSCRLANSFKNSKLVSSSLDALISRSDLILEATHANSSYKIAQKSLLCNRDVMIMSVGGIINKYKNLSAIAARKNRKVYIPSGAICGLDGLKASRGASIKSVTLITTKPPKGLGLTNLKKDKVVFAGNAQEAVKRFPQNINVAAALSIAGIGPDKTRVKIVASPKAVRNSHRIEVVSSAGKVTGITENVAHPDNPKTSFLAVLSAAAALRQIMEPVKIGT